MLLPMKDNLSRVLLETFFLSFCHCLNVHENFQTILVNVTFSILFSKSIGQVCVIVPADQVNQTDCEKAEQNQ